MTPSNKIRFSLLGALFFGAAAVVLTLVSQDDAKKAGPGAPRAAVYDAGTGASGTSGKRPILEAVRGHGDYELRGTVRGADGAPIEAVSVTAVMELGPGVRGEVPADAGPAGGTAIVGNSNAEGHFTLEGMPPGRYRLQVESPEILSSELRFVEAPGNDIQILVSREVAVKGRVMDPTASVLGVQVYLQAEASSHRYQSESDSGGYFSFTEIPEGRYQIFAVHEDRAAPVQTLSRLGVGPFVGVEMLMQEGHAVQGRVVEAGASKLGLAAEVRLHHVDGLEAERRTRSSADGSFVIRGVLPGRWIAEARSPGYLPSSAQSFAAEARRSLEIPMDGGASVTGVVVGPNNTPVPGAVVMLKGSAIDGTERSYSQSSSAPNEVSLLAPGQRLLPKGELGVLLGPIPMPPPPGVFETRVASLVVSDEAESEAPIESSLSNFVTDERGRFRISGVEAGEYRLLVSHDLWADQGSASFGMRHGQTIAGRRIKLQAGTRLSGQVSDDRSVPVVGASIMVNFADGREPALSVSDGEGRFVFAPMTGRVEVVVEALGHARASQSHRLAAGTLAAVNRDIKFRLPRADAYVEGRLVDSTGFSIRNAEIRLEPGPGTLPGRSQRSDEDGLFRLEGLPKGTHWLLISHPNYPNYRVSSATGVQGDLIVPFGGGLAVELRDSSTQSPVAMANLQLSWVLANAKVVVPGVPEEERTMSDESGKAGFVPLRAGNYELRVQKEGYASVSQTLAVKAGKSVGEMTDTRVVEMIRGATIAGILRDAAGDRLVGATIRVGSASSESDKDGRFRLRDVPSGSISLEIDYKGKVSQQDLTLEAGEERVTLELVYREVEKE